MLYLHYKIRVVCYRKQTTNTQKRKHLYFSIILKTIIGNWYQKKILLHMMILKNKKQT